MIYQMRRIFMESFRHGEINEYIQWHDTDGNIINASDGGIIFAEGKYHWYGQALRPFPDLPGADGGQKTDVGVVMYESEDLLNWKYEGVILATNNDPDSPLFGPMRFERPKIIYNDKTKQYVLWCHYVKYPGNHAWEDGTADAGVAVCDTVNGKYKWVHHLRPINNECVRDSTVYKDFDGSAYFIYDKHVCPGGDRCLYVVKLTDDYLSCTDTYVRIEAAVEREAPAIVYRDGFYYIVTSGLTGWATNQAKAFRTRHLLGQWEDIGDPCIDDETHTTFNTQSTYAFPIEGKREEYIVMFERHNISNFVECSYVWLIPEFNDDRTISFRYSKEWKI
jgi:beta-xylosidase